MMLHQYVPNQEITCDTNAASSTTPFYVRDILNMNLQTTESEFYNMLAKKQYSMEVGQQCWDSSYYAGTDSYGYYCANDNDKGYWSCDNFYVEGPQTQVPLVNRGYGSDQTIKEEQEEEGYVKVESPSKYLPKYSVTRYILIE